MNVVQLINGLGLGGGEQMLVELARTRPRTERMSVFTLTRQGPLAEALRAMGVPVRGLSFHGVPLPWRLLVLLAELRNADVLHTHFFYSDLVGGALSRLVRPRRLVATRHEMGYWMRPWHRLVERAVYARHDLVICVSEAVRAAMKARGIGGDRLVVVRPSVSGGERDAATQKRIVAVGRLERVKGHDVLLEAIAHLRDDGRFQDSEVVIAGDGRERAALHERARALSLDGCVRFLGALPPPAARELIDTASIVVQPSRSEGMPLVLLEAMQSGRAVVATAVGGVPELVSDGENGLLVPAEDPGALAEALARLLADPALAKRLGRAAAASATSDGGRVRDYYGESSKPRAVDVCMLVRNDFTIDSRVERVAEALDGGGARVTILAEQSGALPAREERERYTVERLGGRAARSWLRRRTRTLRYYVSSVRRVLEERPAVVHCNDLDTLLPGTLAAKLIGSEVVYDSHELWTERNSGLSGWRKRLDAWRYGLLERLLIGRAKTVFTVSDGIADELARRYAISRPTVLRNVPAAAVTQARSLKGLLPPGGPIILFLGIIDPHRGLEETVEALPELGTARLVLLGTARPSVLEALRQRARALGVLERLIHLPPVPRQEVVAWAREADVGLCLYRPTCLSHALCLPNKFFEYARAGVPIVASDLPELRHYVTTYRLGAVCDSGSPQAIAQTLQDVLARRVPLADAAERQRIDAELSWEVERRRLQVAYPWLARDERLAPSLSPR